MDLKKLILNRSEALQKKLRAPVMDDVDAALLDAASEELEFLNALIKKIEYAGNKRKGYSATGYDATSDAPDNYHR